MQPIDVDLFQAQFGDVLQQVGLGVPHVGRVNQCQDFPFLHHVAGLFLHAPHGAGYAAGQARGATFVVHDFAVGHHGFDDWLPIDHGNVDARLVDGFLRSELDSLLILFAVAVVFRPGQERQRAVGTLEISGRDGRRRLQLRHVGMI